MSGYIGDRAVILGGSIGGLLAARALADSYREVLLVDRDEMVGVEGARRSTPHSFHAQALLARGQQALEELFPGITAELSEAGVPTGDIGADLRWLVNGRQMKQTYTGLVCLAAPRTIMESHLRKRIEALPNVRFQEWTDILGLETNADRSRVIGVRVLRQAKGSNEEIIKGDLVVDTTGRGSRSPIWLRELGYPEVPEDKVKIGLGYATRHYRLPTDYLGHDLAIVLAPTPAYPRGAIFARETPMSDTDSRYLLTLNGVMGDHPPTDPEGFLEFARSLPNPDIYNAIKDAEAVDEPVHFRFQASRWRRFEKMARFPDGFLVMGDAVHSPNPVYAQPITITAVTTLKLVEYLKRGVEPKPLEFFRDLARIIDIAWDITTASDLAHPGIEGTRSLKYRFMTGYIGRLRAAAVNDGSLTGGFLRVAGLVDRPEKLMKPVTMLKVLLNSTRKPDLRGSAPQPRVPGTLEPSVRQ